MNWTSIIIAAGLSSTMVVSVIGAIVVAVFSKDSGVALASLIGVATTMASGLIGWLAKSPMTNGNGTPPQQK